MMLYQTLGVSVAENGTERSYTVTAGAESAEELLSLLLPSSWETARESAGTEVELLTRDGELSRLHFIWNGTLANGNDAALDAELQLDIPQGLSHTLPAEVSAAADDLENAEDLTPELRKVIPALVELTGRDPLNGVLRVSADCGPLLLNQTWEMQFSVASGKELLRLNRGGATLYLTDGAACTAAGTETASDVTFSLLRVLYQTILLLYYCSCLD